MALMLVNVFTVDTIVANSDNMAFLLERDILMVHVQSCAQLP